MHFLDQAATYIFNKHKANEMHLLNVVLPTRRATFFFKKALAEGSDTPFLAPKVSSIDDFISELSGTHQPDQLSLIIMLYGCFKSLNKELEFEKFINWAPTVLKDFDLIDQSMVEKPQQLFTYMSETEALKRWNLEEIEQEATQNYFDFHERLFQVYEMFKIKLQEKKLSYRGLAYKTVAKTIVKLAESTNKIYFVGLNALSRAEEHIIEQLVKENKAECLWDTDSFYMNPANNAGKILHDYKVKKQFGPWNWENQLLENSKLETSIYTAFSNTLQAKLVKEILNKEDNIKNTVIVVLDEAMVQPLLLGGIPETESDLNITMGLGLSHSIEASFLLLLFKFQLSRTDKFHKQTLIDLLRHPVVQLINSAEIIELLHNLELISASYIDSRQIKISNPFVKAIVLEWNNNASVAISNLVAIHKELYQAIIDANNGLEAEFSLILGNLLNRLSELHSSNTLSIESIHVLFKELIKTQKVPFTGQPVAQLQIMSMLETRCLDFDHVIILNFNEGNLPSPKKNQSFIPIEACVHYNLPIYSNQEAIMSYHFYRLLQRAKKASFIYLDQKADGVGGSNEKSRFLVQFETELLDYAKNIKVKHLQLEVKEGLTNSDHTIRVEKTDERLDKIREFLSNEGLAASSLNTYMNCHLEFYFKHIEKLKPKEENTGVFGANSIGNIIHEALEKGDKRVIKEGKTINKESLEVLISRVDSLVMSILNDKFSGYDFSTGVNSIFVELIKKYVKGFYAYEIAKESDYKVIGTEQRLYATMKQSNGLAIKLKGTIDRVEQRENLISLIDYKTGMVKKDKLTFKEDNLYKKDYDKLRQLIFYSYLYFSNNQQDLYTKVVSKIYSFRNLNDDLVLDLDRDSTLNAFTKLITTVAAELTDPSLPILQTEDVKDCVYCNYRDICQRDQVGLNF